MRAIVGLTGLLLMVRLCITPRECAVSHVDVRANEGAWWRSHSALFLAYRRLPFILKGDLSVGGDL
jgi:hypothetical protein